MAMTPLPRQPWRAPLLLLLAAHLALATLFSLIVPLGEAPDEADHYAYVVFIGTQGSLPVGPAVTQGKHPPLYHGLGALLTAWTGLDFDFLRANPDAQHGPGAIYPNHFIHTRLEDFPWRGGALAMHLLRLFSVILSTVTVWGVFALAHTLQPARPGLALAAAAFAGCLPGFLFSSGAVSNDNLAATLGTLILLLALRIYRRGWTPRRGLTLGVLLGLGLLSKVSVLALWPVAALAVFAAAPTASPPPAWRSRIGARALSLTPAVLLAAPWLARNWALYHDLLGWPLVRATVDVRQGPVDLSVLTWLARGLFKTFWGKFGAAGQIEYPAWLYATLLLLSLAALGGLLLKAASLRRGAVLLLALSVGLSLFTLVQYTGLALGTDQARLLWPVIGPLAIGLVAGLDALGRRSGSGSRAWLALAPAAAFVLALLALFAWLRPAYARPAPAPTLAAVNAAPILFGDELALLTAQTDSSRHAPGQPVTVTLTWQALRAPTQDWRVTVALRHPDDDALLADHTNAPTHGRWPTDRWRAGDTFQEIITLDPPAEGVRPSRYDVTVQVRAFGAGDEAWLPVQGAGQSGARARLQPGVPIAPPDLSAPLAQAATEALDGRPTAAFAQGMTLAATDLPSQLTPGQPLTVTLVWAAHAAPTLNLTAFVHLLSPAGVILAQDDRQPTGGQFPTSLWQAGDGSQEVYTLNVPPDAPAGPYTLIAGLYHAPTSRRISVLDQAGQPQDDHVLLATLAAPH